MILTARYLGVAPWELLERDDYPLWREIAWAAEHAENTARSNLRRT